MAYFVQCKLSCNRSDVSRAIVAEVPDVDILHAGCACCLASWPILYSVALFVVPLGV